MRQRHFMFITVLFAACGFAVGCASTPEPAETKPVPPTAPKPVTPPAFSNAEYDSLLKKYVADGRVKYDEWTANAADKAKLADYVKRLGDAKPESFPEAERKAFWINAYNAVTLHAVLEKYPLKSVNFDALKDPKAKAFWDTPYRVGGGDHTLNQIENSILRPQFKDARIHFAINCASVGCPNLQPRSFEAKDLDAALDAATKEYLGDQTKGATFDVGTGKLTISSLFDWYKDDFGDPVEFVKTFRPDITEVKGAIAFLKYDWNLNAAKR